jgi:transposase
MDSEVDLFFPSFSTIQNSIETGSKKLKKNKSAYTIWVHTRTARDKKNSRLKFYIHCTETPSYSTLITTNMRGHLESKHEIIID